MLLTNTRARTKISINLNEKTRNESFQRVRIRHEFVSRKTLFMLRVVGQWCEQPTPVVQAGGGKRIEL
jgi:hypothetical protein